MTGVYDRLLLDLDSEADSEINNLTFLYNAAKKRKKSIWKSAYMRKRNIHGEFHLSDEFADSQIKNYFRLHRKQFDEVHHLIEANIKGNECNAQQPIGTKEKLAVCLRYNMGCSLTFGNRCSWEIIEYDLHRWLMWSKYCYTHLIGRKSEKNNNSLVTQNVGKCASAAEDAGNCVSATEDAGPTEASACALPALCPMCGLSFKPVRYKKIGCPTLCCAVLGCVQCAAGPRLAMQLLEYHITSCQEYRITPCQ